MPHSNFKERFFALYSGVGKCPCSQTFDFASEREQRMKIRMHCKVCPNPPEASVRIKGHKKAMTRREFQNDEVEVRRKEFMITISNIYPTWINITTSERNQEAALSLQELT